MKSEQDIQDELRKLEVCMDNVLHGRSLEQLGICGELTEYLQYSAKHEVLYWVLLDW